MAKVARMSVDWRPGASWQRLNLRANMLRRTRSFFDQRGFLEVETPFLSAETVIDRHIDPIAVTLPRDARVPDTARTLWLQSSPEAAMKRLMASTRDDPDAPAAIYQVTRAFRAGESGDLHNPEFSLVEWYRCGDTMRDGMALLSDLAERYFEAGPAETISYRDAFMRYADIDPLTAEASQLACMAAACGTAPPPDLGDDRDGWLDLLLSEQVAPQLGQQQPTILYDYPASQAALAQVCDDHPLVAERFELFYQGIELANGYHELLDADELTLRMEQQNTLRQEDGKPQLPKAERLASAMHDGLPACTGVALGLDRVVMLAAGATSIAEVITFPIDRA